MGPSKLALHLARLLVPALLTVLAACGGGGGGGEPVRTVTTVTVTSPTVTPKQGDTAQLTAVARDQFGDVMSGVTPTWSSSAPSVAMISSTGLLQALGGGTVTATATISGVAGSLSLTITARVAATVEVSSPTPSPQVGEAVQLTAVARDQFGDIIPGSTATWSASDPSIASVSALGTLKALMHGTVIATATISGVSGSLTLTVSPKIVASVLVTSPTTTPKEGDTVQLTATAYDQFGNILRGVTPAWSTSDPSTAGISTSGLLQTFATGTVVATATINGMSGMQSLTITAIKVSVTIGAKEVVFAYAADHCDDLDTPDLPTHIVRAEDGSLVLFAGDAPRFFVSRGADFNSFERDCSQPVLVSADRRTPESYENWEWISTVYREGNRWHAFVHNEFHDTVASTCKPGDPSPANPCWYNSATYGVSTDGAHSFVKPSAPAHVIAPPPNVWVPPLPGELPNAGWQFFEGHFAPQAIVRKDDGFYYGVLGLTPNRAMPLTSGICLARTDTLGDPTSWRAWDGSGFNLRMSSPYVTGSPAPICRFVPGTPGGGITFNTYLNRYMEVGNYWGMIDGVLSCGVYLSLSADLFHWSKQQLITEIRGRDGPCLADPQKPSLLEPVAVMYFTVIDHADTSVNFDKPGRTAYLYYVRFNRDVNDPMYWLDRDLVRVPLTFTRVD